MCYFCQVEKKHFTYFLFILLFTQFFFNSVQAQHTKIDITSLDVDFETILKEISRKTGLTYQLQCKKISKKQKFFIDAKDISVEEILEQCLAGSKLHFEIKDKTIIIYDDKRKREHYDIPVLYQTIKGTIRDAESKKALEGANVVIVNGNPAYGSTSDENGIYHLENIPIGRYTIKASFVGYNEVVIPEILLGSAKEVVLNIDLTESMHSLEQVIIQADKERPINDMAFVSARSFRVEETKRYAASFSDPARMALSYAGVATTDDYLNEIIVRGNSPQYLLWRIEGVEVPSPNHFTNGGLNGGAVSILSSNVVGRSDFLTGAFPADYGNAMSGVFDIFLRNGNYETHETSIQAGTLGIDVAAEGPLKKGYSGSYLFNYRFSTLAFLNLINLGFLNEAAPDYQDLSFKINLPTKKHGKFSFWGVGGISYDKTEGITDSVFWNPGEIMYHERWADYMMALGVSHTIFPNHNSYFKTTLALTKYGSSHWIDTLGFQEEYDNILSKKLYTTSYRLSLFYNNKISKWLSFRLGSNINYSDYNYFFDASSIENFEYTFLDTKGLTFLSSLYAETKIKFSEKLKMNAGLNYMYFDLNEYTLLEPRFALQWDFSQRQSVSFGYGLHARHEPLVVYFKEYYQQDGSFLQLNSKLDLPNAQHFVLSYSNRINNDFYLKMESYYQGLTNYYVAADPDYTFSAANSYLDFNIPLSSSGIGRNYGAELTFEKYFTKNYYFLITASLFKSEYQAANKVWYSTIYDLGHIYNLVAGREFNFGYNQNNILGLNFKVSWTGGRRDTPIDEAQSVLSGFTVYDEFKRNTIQYPDYFRIDFGLNYRVNKEKVAHIFSLEVQNITNRRNIAYKYYNSSLKTFIIQKQAGMIPVFNYRLEF